MSKKKAQSMSEWAMMVLLITVACMSTLLALGPNLQGVWAYIDHALEQSLGQNSSQ